MHSLGPEERVVKAEMWRARKGAVREELCAAQRAIHFFPGLQILRCKLGTMGQGAPVPRNKRHS